MISVSGNEAELEKELSLRPGSSLLQMACDTEGKTLVVTDDSNTITVFDTEKNTSFTLPSHTAPVTAIGVHPLTKVVVAAYANMSLKEYDPATRRYTPFCRQHLSTPSPELVKKHSVIQHVSFDLSRPNLTLLHNDSAFIVLKKGKQASDRSQERAKKMKKGSESPGGVCGPGEGAQFSVIRRPNQVLYFGQVKGQSVVSVELNPLLVMDRLPSPLKVKKYGGTWATWFYTVITFVCYFCYCCHPCCLQVCLEIWRDLKQLFLH